MSNALQSTLVNKKYACVTFLNDLRLAPLLPPVLVLEHCLDLSLQFKQELLASLSHRDRPSRPTHA